MITNISNHANNVPYDIVRISKIRLDSFVIMKLRVTVDAV